VTILLVDDDIELCGLLTEYLLKQGFAADSAHDGAAGLAAVFRGAYDIVILDVMLPRIDGFEVLRQLRARTDVPVILLTARGQEADRLRGFDSGADDYLVKPFVPAELLARIRAVLKRVQAGRPTRDPGLRVGPIALNRLQRRVWVDGVETELTTMEFDLLDVLMSAAGRVVSRDEIAAALHQREASPFERSLDVHVSNLRKKLAPHGESLVRTVRGVGYLLSME
jgi:two-component system response regulator CpxR